MAGLDDLPRHYLHLVRITANQKLVRAKILNGFLFLTQRRANDGHFSPKRLCKFDGHMAEPTQAHDTHIQARLVEPKVPQRAVSGDAGTEEWGPNVEGKIFGPTDDEMLVGHHDVRVATVRDGPIHVSLTVRLYCFRAVIFETVCTLVALPARSDHTPDTDFVADHEFLDFGAHFEICNLLENLKGEKTPDVSLAAHPKAFTGCSVSYDFAIFQ
ncbi:DNA gyrase subunit B [Striga asiatica]|uniref:DNA gyrase subunit B n=1 Tax=Striga asiatica TaxID=4170 RepID=A0A5A7QPW9_STRAF|nr:DNA gyrase subunit B [Striga asiatica]